LFASLIVTFACKHNQDNKKPEPANKEMVKITIQKGEHVASVKTEEFQLEKGAMLGRSEILQKVAPTFESGFEFDKFCVNNQKGSVILDNPKYKFSKDRTLFIVARAKSTELCLNSLSIDTRQMTLTDSINAGSTPKEKVPVDVTFSPSDAQIEFAPRLDSENNWVLQNGENTLTIKVKKESQEKTYTVKLIRDENASGGPALLELSIGKQKREGSKIQEKMGFAVPQDQTRLSFLVVAKANDAQAEIIYDPPLENGNIVFQEKEPEKNFTVTVDRNGEAVAYQVKVLKMTNAGFYAGSKNGVIDISEDDQNKVAAGEKGLSFTIHEPLVIELSALAAKYKSCKINGKEVETNKYSEYVVSGVQEIMALQKGEEKDINIKIEAVGGTQKEDGTFEEDPSYTFEEEFSFHVKRSNETADIPIYNFLVGKKEFLYGHPEFFPEMFGDRRAEIESGEPAKIKVTSFLEIESATIGGNVATVTKTKYNKTEVDFWEVEGTVTGFESNPKDVDFILIPKDKENYGTTTLQLKMKYKEPPKVELAYYEINNTTMYSVPAAFKEGLAKGTEPTIKVKGNAINIKMATSAKVEKVKVNDQDLAQNVLKEVTVQGIGKVYSFNHSIVLSGKTKIKIELFPHEKGEYSKNELVFYAEGSSAKEEMKPYFLSIGKHTNFSKSFKEKIAKAGTDASFAVKEDKAELVINLKGYDAEFLCKEVTINNNKVEKEVIGIDHYYYPVYQVKKEITGLTTEGKDITIVFKGQDNIAEDVTWKFKLKSGGTNPSLPMSEVDKFIINGYGNKAGFGVDYLFSSDFLSTLTDEEKPLFEFHGRTANVSVDTFGDKIKNVSFKIDSETPEFIEMKKEKAEDLIKVAKHSFILNDENEHEVEVVVYPTDEVATEYSELKYTFKLKSLGAKPAPNYVFGIDGDPKAKENGYRATLPQEIVTILVQQDQKCDMEKVEIGVEGSPLENYKIEEIRTKSSTSYQASATFILEETEKTYVIKVTPIDKQKYDTVLYKFHLTGKKQSQDNAEFLTDQFGHPRVKTPWTCKDPSLKTDFYNDYGVEKIKIIAQTKSPRAKVKYQFVNAVTNQPIPGTEGSLTSDGKGKHISDEITLYADKSTKVKAWVISENNTTDDTTGVWYRSFNEVPVFWSPKAQPTGDEIAANKAYDKIEVRKTDVEAGIINLAIIVWNENEGHAVLSDGLGAGHTPFVKVGQLPNKKQEMWHGIVNVSSMQVGQTKDIFIKINKDNVECINHKITIVMK